MGLSKGLDGYNYTYNVINNFPYGVGSGGTSSSITVGGLAYTMLTFTSTGTFTVTTAGMFDCTIIGGGAAGTQNGVVGNGGGGGGAGALVISQENYFAVGPYVVAVGGGGSISYVGKYASGRPLGPGQGAKGNVGAGDSPIVGGFSGGSGIGVGPNGNSNGGGGGGGMGGAGGVPSLDRGYGIMVNGGAGGIGIDWSLWRGQTAGTTRYGAGGGGSGGYGSTISAAGGTGGGGQGGLYYNDIATAGTANTGSGGGGGTEGASARSGGSGLVLIRFKL